MGARVYYTLYTTTELAERAPIWRKIVFVYVSREYFILHFLLQICEALFYFG